MTQERMTTAEYRARYGKGASVAKTQPQATPGQWFGALLNADKPAKPTRRGVQNGLELRFAQEVLLPEQAAGEIKGYQFEAITFRMQSDAKYTPDYFVEKSDGSLVCFETKGHWRPQARIRIKWAAQRFPMFKFIAVQRIKGEWIYEEF
jgi:hypothetical protein